METLVTLHNHNNPHTYSLIWLDASVNCTENVNAQEKFRETINDLKTFEECDRCEQYIRSLSQDDRVVLIVSGQLGRQLVSEIHHLSQVSTIYVYCFDKSKHGKWANKFKKVKNVIVELEELITQIRSDQKERIENKVHEPICINIFNTNGDNQESIIEQNNSWIYSQKIMDFLGTKPNLNDQNEFIEFCLNKYYGNTAELTIIEEFQQNYSSNQSIWWYTRNSFLQHLLQQAIYVKNIDLLFLLHFFIYDIQRQLKQYQCSSSVRVYHSLTIPNEQLKRLRNSIGQFILIDSFLLTSINRQQTLFTLQSSIVDDDLQKILFDIDADPRLHGIKPFANIKSLSYFHTEEILFMCGSIFRLIDIHMDENDVWIIRLTLCSDDEHDLKSILDNIQDHYNYDENDLVSFGYILRDMSKFDEAEKYFSRLLKQLSSDHENLAVCYDALGNVTKEKGDYKKSIVWYQNSLDIKMQIFESDNPDIASTLNKIGEVQMKKGDYRQSIESYEKALMISKRTFGDTHPNVAYCISNIGIVYYEQKKYSKALECHQEALAIRMKHYSGDHLSLSYSYSNIGDAYFSLGQYDLALEHYRLSMKIKSKSLPSQHVDIAKMLQSMATVHEKKGDFEEALSFYKRAVVIYRHTLSSSHSTVIQVEQDIQRISFQ